MSGFWNRLYTKFVEPTIIFEQLEERIVLNATIDAATTQNQNVQQDAAVHMDVHAADEGQPGFSYALQVNDGTGAKSVAAYNAANNPAAADIGFNSTTGVIDWTPNNLNVGIFTFSVTANDGGNGTLPHTDSQNFTVTVTNLPPVFSGPTTASFAQDGGSQSFSDLHTNEDGKGVQYSLAAGSPTWLSVNATTGEISGNPGDGQVGVHNFTVHVNDGNPTNGTADQAFTLTVTNKLDFTSANNATVVEDSALLFNVNTDTETSGKPVTYSLVAGTPSWVHIDSSTGVLTANPDNTLVGAYDFTIHADGGAEGAKDQAFHLTVANNPPQFINYETTIHLTETSGSQIFDVQNADEGVSSAATPYSLVSYDGGAIPTWMTINSTTGVISSNPLNHDVGSHTLVVQFDDGHTPDGVQTQTFTVNIANKPNYFDSSAATTWIEDASGQSFNVHTHEEGQAGANITYSFAGGALVTEGWLAIDPNTGVLSALSTPDNSQVGDHLFTIFSSEGNGAPVITQAFTLTVANTPPVITSPNVINVVEDAGANTYQMTLQSPEPGATYSILSPPSIHGSAVTIDATTGLLHIPAATNSDVGGIYIFNVQVDDGHGGIATQFMQLAVANKVPVFTALPAIDPVSGKPTFNATEDTLSTFNFNTDDEGDGPTSYSLAGAPTGVSIDGSGLLSVNATNASVGDHTFTVTFNDGHGGVITQDVVIHVDNVAPIITSPNTVTWIEDAGYQTFDVQATDEAQGPHLYSLSGAPAWLSIDPNTGAMISVPENAQVGVYNFDIISDDGHGGVDTQHFTLNVQNTAPVWDSPASVYFDLNGGEQTADLHTTDEESDHNNLYTMDSLTLPSWLSLSIDPKTGKITVDPNNGGSDPKVDTTINVPVHFFDGTVTIDSVLSIHLTVDPPAIGPDHDNIDFFSANKTRFLEDEPNQHFDFQYKDEGAGYTYSFDPADPNVTNGGLTWGGWLTIDANTGIMTGSPDNSKVTAPLTGTPYIFDVIVKDAANVEVARQSDFKLHVDNVVPWWTTPAINAVITEDSSVGVIGNVNNSDEGQGAETAYSLVNGTDTVPTWLTINNAGQVSYTRVLTNNDIGSWAVKVKFDDGHGGVIDKDLSVSVRNVLNFTTGNTGVWQEDSSAPFTFQVHSDDEGTTHGVQYSLSGAPSWITIDSDGWLHTTAGFSPDNTYPGQYRFTIHGDDGNGGGDQVFTLTIPNRDPVFDAYVNTLNEDGGVQTINLHADDEGQGATYYTWSGAPQWMSMNPHTGVITADPTNQHVGDYTFTVTAWDTNGGRAYGFVDASDPDGIHGYTTETITIHVANRDPVFSSAASTSVLEGSGLSYNVQSDDESDGGTTYSLVGAPSWVAIDPITGLLTGSPKNPEVGVYNFTIKANDTHGGIVDQAFTLTVVNKAPVFLNPPGNTYTLTLTEDAASKDFNLLSDQEGQHNVTAGTQVVYSLDPALTLPGIRFAFDGGAGFDGDAYGYTKSTSGLLTIAPTNRDVIDSIVVPITVDDGNGGVATMNFTVKVNNTAPTFTTPNAVIWTEDALTNMPFNVNTTDEQYERSHGDTILYTTSGAPSWLVIDGKTGELSVKPSATQNANGSPDNSFVGVHSFAIDFYDGTVHVQQIFSLTVNNSPTSFTTHVVDREIHQDQWIHVTDAEVKTVDEYSMYTQDYYSLEIRLSNQGPWIQVDATHYNTANNAWNGADISFDTKTGAIDWNPNNADVPKFLDGGVYHHQFKIVHHDGHGSTAEDTFFVKVINDPPTLPQDPIPPYVPNWSLTEDAASTYQGGWVESNEENVGVHYNFQVSLDGGITWTSNLHTGDRINGPTGGQLTINATTGKIDWTPTNADVTLESDGTTVVRPPYVFRVQADDGNPVDNLSPWREFNVDVTNTATLITDAPTSGTVGEDSNYSFNIQASDEEQERPTPPLDTYYEMRVNDGTGWKLVTDYNTYLGVAADHRAYVNFNTDTGLLEWNPNHADTLHAGAYQFEVTHYDGAGTHDTKTFDFTVANRPPDVTIPGTWTLHEDDTVPGQYTYHFASDDETYTTVNYEVQVFADIDGSGPGTAAWITLDSTGIRPNGPDGGIIKFDAGTHDLQWITTNEDVTYDAAGNPTAPYQIRVHASDGVPNYATWSAWKTFDTVVQNDPTHITLDPSMYTDAPNKTILVQQDGAITVTDAQVSANDEYPHLVNFTADDHYTLEINLNHAGVPNWQLVDATHYNAANDAWNGADILFDAKTGAILWTPNNADVPKLVDAQGQLRHELRLTHYDGHGSSDADTFFVKVGNVAPSLDDLPNWSLHEDDGTLHSTTPALWTYDQSWVTSDEEGKGVHYALWVSLDSGAHYTQWTSGNKLNETSGGAIIFNDVNGEIQWKTTNADVTLQADGTTPVRTPYVFKIQANDGNTSNNLSPEKTFTVNVTNEPTTIPSAPPATGHITEDTPYSFNFQATDEEIERTGQDTHYTLEILDGATWKMYDVYNGENGNRADIGFDPNAGQFDWTPNDSDTQMGDHQFRVTHYDANGSTDVKLFTQTVDDRPPQFTYLPVTWTLHEDDPVAANYTLDLATDDDIHTAVTYGLRVSLDNGATWTPFTGDYKPNGATGGTLHFDTATGVVQWQTTNADVTLDSLGGRDHVAYKFEVTADDHHSGSHVNTKSFNVDVTNEVTVLPVIAPQTVTEDLHLTIDNPVVQANDELVGPGTFYTLEVDGHTLTAAEYAGYQNIATGGLLIFDTSTGKIDWDPTNADVGVHTFTVTHNDGHESTSPQTFAVTVNNNPPSLTVPTSWTVHEDTLYTLAETAISSNDEGYGPTQYKLYVDGHLWVPGYKPNTGGGAIAFNTSNGQIDWTTTNADVTLNSDGSVARSPYVFKVQVDDGHGGVVSKDFNVDVTNADTVLPVIGPQTVTEDSHLTIDNPAVQANDELVGPGTFYTLEIDKGQTGAFVSLAAYNTGNGVGGDITFDTSTGKIDWDPNNADVATYNFRVTHNDGHVSTSAQPFLVTVNNRPPVITNPGNWVLTEDDTNVATYTRDIQSDDESQGGVTYSLSVNGTLWTGDYQPNGPTGGTLHFDTTTGEITWRTTNADVTMDSLGGRDNPAYVFSITADDHHSSNNTSTINFNVDVANTVTVLPAIANQTVVEDSHLTVDNPTVQANDELVGPDTFYTLAVDGHTLTAAEYAGYQNIATGGLLTFNSATGKIDWDPTNADVGVHNFTVTHNDGHESTSPQTFAVTVNNNPPSLTVPSTTWVVHEDTPDTLPETAIGSNDEGYGPTQYKLYVDGVLWTVGYKPNTGGGAIVFNTSNGQIDWTTTNADVTINSDTSIARAPYVFKVEVNDGHGGVVSKDFNVDVTNEVTVLPAIANQTVTEDSHLTIDNPAVQANDELVGPGTFYTLEIDKGQTGAFVSLAAYNTGNGVGGDITFDTSTGKIDWDPNNADVATYNFRVTHNDGHVSTSPQTFQVTVANNSPSLTVPPSWTVHEDTLYTLDQSEISSNDEGYGATYSLSVSKDGGITWTSWTPGYTPNTDGGAITFDTSNGQIDWTTTNADVTINSDNSTARAPFVFKVEVNDGHGGVVSKDFNVDVTNAATVLPVIGPQTVTEDSHLTVDNPVVQANDELVGPGTFYTLEVDGHTLTTAENAGYQHVATGGLLTFNSATGKIDWDPNNADVGVHNFTVTHHDGHVSTSAQPFQVTVANNPPSLTVPSTTWVVHEDTPYTLDQSEITSNDEGYGPTQYKLYVDGVLWTAGYKPNTDGWAIAFNTSNGQIDWTTTNADVTINSDNTPARAPYVFKVEVNDGHGGVVSKDFNVDVTNDATDLPSVGDQVVAEGTSLTITDSAVHARDELVGPDTFYTLLIDKDKTGSFIDVNTYNSSNGLGADITFDSASGRIDWTPNNKDTASYNFKLIHNDGHKSTAEDTFEVKVTNLPPTLTVPTEWTVHEDTAFTLDQSQISSDQEGVGPTQYRLYVDGHLWTPGYTPNSDGGGEIIFNVDNGEIKWTTTNADVTQNTLGGQDRPAYVFTIEVDDGHGAVNSMSFDVNVTNEPTKVTPIADQVITEDGAPLVIGDAGVVATDELVGSGTSYSLEIQRAGDPKVSDVNDYNANNGEGSDIVFDDHTGAIHWDTTNRDVGDYTFVVTHHDGHKGDDSSTFDVTVKNNPPSFTSEVSTGLVIPGTHTFYYNAQADDEGLHDWRGDSKVTYSLEAAPVGMTIDSETGVINWRTDPTMAGNVYVTIKVDDGHGGFAFQTFSFMITNDVNNLPLEHRPENVFPNTLGSPQNVFDGPDSLDSGRNKGLHGRLGWVPDLLTSDLSFGDNVDPWAKTAEELLRRGHSYEEDLLKLLEGYDLKQPSLDPNGSAAPITQLAGYTEGIMKGKRLDFDADNVQLWEELMNIYLKNAGSEAPDTPLEGYHQGVEAGKRLNFEYNPIHEALSMKLDDIKAADLFGA